MPDASTSIFPDGASTGGTGAPRPPAVATRLAPQLVAATLAAALAWPGCSFSEPVAPVQLEVGKEFSLSPGTSAQAVESALQIGFDAVTADSRCAKGERCVWAGDATVRIWWQQAGAPRQTRELHAAPGAGQAVRVQAHELRLLRLDPYPVTGRRIAPAGYVATFSFSPAADIDATR